MLPRAYRVDPCPLLLLSQWSILPVYTVANDPWPSHENFPVICFLKLTLSQWHMWTIFLALFYVLYIHCWIFLFSLNFSEDLMQLCIFLSSTTYYKDYDLTHSPRYTLESLPLPYILNMVIDYGSTCVKTCIPNSPHTYHPWWNNGDPWDEELCCSSDFMISIHLYLQQPYSK